MQLQTHKPAVDSNSAMPTCESKDRLDALTSLRFFAAAMIVILHSVPTFGVDAYGVVPSLPLANGVSFFFVLSGFILTYVYQGLRGVQPVREFLTARLARIWPGHVLATILALWIIKKTFYSAGDIFMNLFMLQSWAIARTTWPINQPSWTISTELFFYISFVVLIRPWQFGWCGKLAVSLIAAFSILACTRNPLSAHLGFSWDPILVVCTHPLARLFEFVLGMSVCGAWLRWRGNIRWERSTATLFEFGAVLAFPLQFVFLKMLVGSRTEPWCTWLLSSGCAPAFGVLIYVIALQAGYLSRILSIQVLVWLGEISYSIYLLHYPIMEYFTSNRLTFDGMDKRLVFSLYIILILVCSDLNYALVEKPMRRWLRKPVFHTKDAVLSFLKRNLAFSPRRYFLAAEAILAFCIVLFTMNAKTQINFTLMDLPKDIHFGERFVLEKASIGTSSSGALIVRPSWRSLAEQRLNFLVGVHLIDENGAILSQQDYIQAGGFAHVNQAWTDTIYIPEASLKNVTGVALALAEQKTSGLLPVDRGERDWKNHRLILSLANRNCGKVQAE